jgi:hypothetical protein
MLSSTGKAHPVTSENFLKILSNLEPVPSKVTGDVAHAITTLFKRCPHAPKACF